MASRSIRATADVGDGPRTRVYGSVLALLLAVRFLQHLLAGGVTAVERAAVAPRLVGTVVYAVVGLALLAALFLLVRRTTGFGRGLDAHDHGQLAGVAAMLLLMAAYVLHGRIDLPTFPGVAFTTLLTGAAAAGLAVGFARLRGEAIPFDLPDGDALPVAGATVGVATVAGVAWVVALAELAPTPFGFAFEGQFGPDLSGWLLVWHVVLPAAFVGVASAVLYTGAVQGALRSRVGPAEAVGAVTALVGVGSLAVSIGVPENALYTAAAIAALVVASVVVALAAERGTAALSGALDVAATPALGAAVGFALVALLWALAQLATAATPRLVVYGLGVTATGAAAAWGFERSRTVWVPALAFVAFRLLTDALLSRWLAETLL